MRFFATGDLQQALSFSYRIGKVTASNVISKLCQKICTVLKEPYLASSSLKQSCSRCPNNLKKFMQLVALTLNTLG